MDKHAADKQAADKQATDKHRLGSAYVTACCPRRSPMTKPRDNPHPRRYDKNIDTPPTVTAG